MTIKNPQAFIGHLQQKVNLALKHNDITGAQAVAFNRRLDALLAADDVGTPAWHAALAVVEQDLSRWRLQ